MQERWVVLIINRVLDRPNQVRYQRIVALAGQFNVIVISKAPIPGSLETLVDKVWVERSGLGVLSRALAECRRLKEAGHACYVHTQYALYPLAIGYLCKRMHETRWVYDLWDHPSLGWLESAGPMRWVKRMLWYGLMRKLVTRADAWVIAMHPGILGRMPPAPVSCRLIFMRPGFDDTRGSDQTIAVDQKRHDARKVVYVGSVSCHRGLDLMADWVDGYRGEPVELCIAGPCRDRDSELLIGKMTRDDHTGRRVSVRYLGEIGAADVDSLLDGADIALSPVDVSVVNYRYAYPVKVVQYMSHGLIVVGTESHGMRGVIVDGHNGVLSQYDPSSFRNAMDRALSISNDPDRRNAMCAAARETAKENSWAVLNAKLVQEIVGIVDR